MNNDISMKPILCLDFDGVCSTYKSGWQGAGVINDLPVNGLFEFLEKASYFFTIQIFSSRSNQEGGIRAMRGWFARHYCEWKYGKGTEIYCPSWIEFPTEKPPAFIGLDDRVMLFDGTFPDVERLRNFIPWWKDEQEAEK